MGTRALAGGEWLLSDGEREAQLAQKRVLLETARGVVAATSPGAGAAEAEAADLVGHAAGVALDPGRPPLEAAALLVQEDLCVLVAGEDGWRLAGGVVCFPSLWRVTDKVGLPLAAVHGPVPAYADELAGRVDRFLDRLRPDRPVWRRNWLVHDSPELHQPGPRAHAGAPGVPRVPDGLWLRSERQTLRRLPVSGGVLFTIRTQQAPLAVLASRPHLAGRMSEAVRSWSDELVGYRGAAPWRDAVTRWLDGLAAPSPGAG